MPDGLTFTEHLGELRRRIIIALISLAAASVITLPLSPYMLKALKAPAAGALDKLVFFGPEEGFLIYMRLGLLTGLVLASPVILYQFWAFVAPAIEERFRRHIALFSFSSALVFASGCVFAYFVLLPQALRFLLGFATVELEPLISASRYISFATTILLWTGIIFEMPVASFILTRVGALNARFLRRKYGTAVIAVFVSAAVITPTTDIVNMMLLAVPMLLLYEISIWVSALAGRKKS